VKRVDNPVGIDPADESLYEIQTHDDGPDGTLPLDPEFLRTAPSGDIFALSQNVGMGWRAAEVLRRNFLIISTLGGVRNPDGTPSALGYHTGHWEVGLLVQAAADTFSENRTIPFAGFVSDPCDGRTQGTPGMMDSLPYRNDASVVMRRLIRSLPTRRGVMGVATCDKGLPATIMALVAQSDLPTILVPGGVTLLPREGEDAGTIQTIGSRYAHDQISLEEASELGCKTCASPGGGCQFMGTAATTQVVGEAMGLSLPHAALAPSGQGVWRENAERSARALMQLESAGITTADVVTDGAVHNAMAVHAAVGGSTNLLLHIPAIAHAAGLIRPTVDDWHQINLEVPRLVDVMPNGPQGFPTVYVYLAGGVPEIMLHLRRLGLLNLDVLTASGVSLGEVLDSWEQSERRRRMRRRLVELDGVDPADVIMDPDTARSRGLTSTVCFPRGNLAPHGSVIKSTAIDPTVVDADGVYRKVGPARVFTTERDAIAAIKSTGPDRVKPGDIMVLIGRGPAGCGMEETYQVTSALKFLENGNQIALITDARFSGVSTGACIGHVGPEALAGGPVGKVRDGDTIEIVVDRNALTGTVNLVGEGEARFSPDEGARLLNGRTADPRLKPDEGLPDDTRLWAALQNVSGGVWGGCVYDVDKIVEVLEAGRRVVEGEYDEQR
jgi:putative YjhG/YagF family dehydratase